MADIKDRIGGLIKAMEDLSRQGDISEADLKNFVQLLETISGTSGEFAPKMSKVVGVIHNMVAALEDVGASEKYVSDLKISLGELARQYEHTGLAASKMRSLSGLGLVGRETGMAEWEQEQRVQRRYLAKALATTTDFPVGSGGGTDIESMIGARASSLRLIDDMQRKLLQQTIIEKQLTLEIEAQTAARRAQREAFIQQPGLGQKYGEILTAKEAPPTITPEQIRVEQDAQYEALKEEYSQLRPGPASLFDETALAAEREAHAVNDLTTEVDKLTEAYSKAYFGFREMPSSLNDIDEAIQDQINSVSQLVDVEKTQQEKRDELKLESDQLTGKVEMTRPKIIESFGEFIPGGDFGIENLNKQLEKYGVEAARVTLVTQEMSNGIVSMHLQMDKGQGVIARGTIHMDQYGNVLRDTSRRFKSFGDAVGTNILKVTQWAIATGIVYGIVRQLGQVIKETTEIQGKLASVQIALGDSQGDLNLVFEEALNIANLTSSSVAGVVEAYALAYRATGQYAVEAERLAVTNVLLKDSMILAELAGTDQATALDTLVGALRQTGRELDDGQELLDKWVFVSRQANVSLDTLAQTYAIVGATAKGVGIEMEELNALAATLAESTGLSATETGNALRGIIAGFQSASSEKTLARFGIATRDATGQLRDFMSLYSELAALTQSGVLSERDISEISNAIGGGYRRGAQVQTLLMNSASVARLVAEQSGAGGAAAEALGIQMATLESAITRLGNAFTKFAQTMGSEGGFLGIITSLVDGMSSLLGILTDLVGGMGKWTPIILAFGAAWAALGSSKGQDLLKGLLGKDAGFLGTIASRYGAPVGEQQILSSRLAQVTGGPGMPGGYSVGQAGQSLRGGAAAKLGGLDPLALVAPSLIALGAFQSAAEKAKLEPDTPAAGLEVGRGITSIVGAIVGGLVTAGSPMGIAAGSAMASAFYKGLVQYEDDIAGFWAGAVREAEEERKKEEEEPRAPAEDMISFGSRALAGISGMYADAAQWLGATGEGGLGGTGIGSRQGAQDLDPRAILTQQAQATLTYLETGEVTSGLYAYLLGLMDETTARAILENAKSAMEGEAIVIAVELDMAEGIKELKPVVGPIIDDFIAEQQRKLILGDISLPEFTKLPQILDSTKIATQMQKMTTAADFAGMSIDVQEYTAFILELDEATRGYLTTLADDVVSAHTAWQVALREQKLTLEEIEELEEEYYTKRDRYATMAPAVEQAHDIEQIARTPVMKVGRLSQAQVAIAVRDAQAYTHAYHMEIADGSEENARILADQMEPFMIQYGEGLGSIFGESIGGTTVAAVTQAIKDHGWESELSEVDFGFQDVRESLGMGDIPDLMSRYQKVVGTFQTFFPDYEVDEQNVGLITKDGLTTVHADLTLLNLAMQDLIDVNEQQLEGVWNIPAGMTAMVAWSSIMSREIGGGGAVPTEGEVFTEDRQPDGEEPDVLTALSAQLDALNAFILDMQKVLAMGPEELGMQEMEATRADLREAQKEKESVLEQIALTQLGQGMGITAQGDVSVAEQLREALTIQNKIELNANIRLVVDGRTLANIVKQYLFEDLVSAADKTSGTGSGDYVIGH